MGRVGPAVDMLGVLLEAGVGGGAGPVHARSVNTAPLRSGLLRRPAARPGSGGLDSAPEAVRAGENHY